MRVVLQRVTRAAVAVDGAEVASIGLGYLLLVGVGREDTEADTEQLAAKIVGLRIFRDATNLAAAPELWPTTENALTASDWFVLRASPLSAQSEWVQREVGWWTHNRVADRILNQTPPAPRTKR